MNDSRSFVLILLLATPSLNSPVKARLHTVGPNGVADFGRSGRSPGMSGFARIDRASGMMSFPRVGRSDPTDYDVVFDFNPEDITEVKRQGLIPYPRVGRSHDVSSSSYGNELVKVAQVKRTGDAVPNGGMWFGPRLGRLHRRAGDEQLLDDQQWAVYPLREFSGSPQQSDNFSPMRLAHEQQQQQQQQQQRQQHDSEPEDGIQSTLNTGAIY